MVALRLPDSVLGAESLAGLGVLLGTARRTRTELLAREDTAPRLARLAESLVSDRELEEQLGRSFDETGEVADGASRALKGLRRTLRDRRAALVERLERYARDLPGHVRVPDASVTVRGGRYCIPIRREGRSGIGGIVHDESASRQTLFVEPPLAIEPMNEIREAELEEAREVERILRSLTEALRPGSDDLTLSLKRLAEIDSVWARARYAGSHGGQRPRLGEVSGRGAYRVVEGRHPLLLVSGKAPVPFTLNLEAGESLLLVSGPNAGGKTVLLKSIGLLSVMSQSGIVPPVGAGTVLPCFADFFAVIGDEQSIDASLSTFSAHLGNLRDILDAAGARSLVLVDEIGSHTDPEEGAALAAVVLERLLDQAGLTVATTHLGALKALASEHSGVVNASLQFDSEELRPTFQCRRDRPGRSYALQIAERLGMPPDLVADARARLSDLDRAMEELLADLESREAELEVLTRAARAREGALAEEEQALLDRRTSIERREAQLERTARSAEEKYVRAARRRIEDAVERLEADYATALSRLRSHDVETSPEETRQSDKELAAAKRAARSVVERAIREASGRTAPVREAEDLPELEAGVRVRVRGLDRVATIEEVRGDRVILAAEGLRLTVPATELEAIEFDEDMTSEDRRPGGAETGPRASSGEARPAIQARAEVDLRGLRVDEVEPVLLPAIDAAIVADLPALRIIHGKGTGAVRAEVQALLDNDRRIPNYRLGGPGEGGEGVTVVEFANRTESGNE